MITFSSESYRTEEERHGMRGEKTYAQPHWIQNSPCCDIQTHSFPTGSHHNDQQISSRFLTSITSYLCIPLTAATTTTKPLPFLLVAFQKHNDGDMEQEYARSDTSSSRSSSRTENYVDLVQRSTALRKETGRIDADDTARLDQTEAKKTDTRKRLCIFDILPDEVL